MGKLFLKIKDIYEGNLLNEIIEGKDKMKYLNENEYNEEWINN